MRSIVGSTWMILGLAATGLAVATGCQSDDGADQPAGQVATRTDAAPKTDSAGGDVVRDSATTKVAGKWLTDANILSLVSTMNSRQIAAADIELEAWHSDTVRAFAASVAREHAEIQHSIDSVAAQLHLSPIAPALADQVTARMQSEIDSLGAGRTVSLDRAFLNEQIGSQSLVSQYLEELSAVAEHPELQGVLASAQGKVDAQAAKARALQAAFVHADSVHAAAAADSAAQADARREARRAARRKP